MILSVVMPIYNSAKHLDESIQSVLNQSGDFELILIDDGSKDNSLEICRSYEKADSRVRVVHTENCGVSHARNTGIDLARGDYIEFVDSDDLLADNTVKTVTDCIEKCKPDVIVFGLKTFGNSSEEFFVCDLTANTNEQVRNAVYELNKSGQLPSSVNKVYSKKFIGNTRFNETVFFAEDYLFNIDLFYNLKSICCLKEIMYFYRREGASLSSSFDVNAIEITESIYQKNRKIFEKYSISDFSPCEKAYAYSMTAVLNRMLNSKTVKPTEKAKILKKSCTDDYIRFMNVYYCGMFSRLLAKRRFGLIYYYTKLINLLKI